MSADFPGAPEKASGESDADYLLRQCAYNDGRFGHSYGTGFAEEKKFLDALVPAASNDTPSLQRRVDAFKAGAQDRRAFQMKIFKKSGLVVGTMVVIGATIQFLRTRK